MFVTCLQIKIYVYKQFKLYILFEFGHSKLCRTTRRLVWIKASLGGRAHFTFRLCLGGSDWLARCGHWSHSVLHTCKVGTCICIPISMHVCMYICMFLMSIHYWMNRIWSLGDLGTCYNKFLKTHAPLSARRWRIRFLADY